MKRSLLVLLFIIALLVALACRGNGDGAPSADDTPAGETPTDGAGGEGGELTLEEYFQRIEALGYDLDDRKQEALSTGPVSAPCAALSYGMSR